MSFLDGILKKQDPSERVKAALIADLELRRKDDRASTRFSGYAYRGSADLILQHGEFFPGRAIPEEYWSLVGMPQGCFYNTLIACETHPELRYFHGVYTTGAGYPALHAWAVAPDGGVVELTMPTTPDVLTRAHSARTKMPFLATEHWGYYGVQFRPELMRASLERFEGAPLLDRGPAEVVSNASEADPETYNEPHDFPILKVPYDPTRTELPT